VPTSSLSCHKSSKSNVVTAANQDSRGQSASAPDQLPDDDDGESHPRVGRATQNPGASSLGGAPTNHSATGSATCKHSRCCVTSSQVRGSGGKTRRHRRPMTTDDCSSLHGCCSDGQTRPPRRCRCRRKPENCPIIDSGSCCSGSSSSPCSCPVTSKESSTDVDCCDYDDEDAATCCCCCMAPGPLLQPTPWLCCLNSRDVSFSQRLAHPVRLECYPSPMLPTPVCRPFPAGQCCPVLPQLCYLDEACSRQLACACHGYCVAQSPTMSSPVLARPGPGVCSGSSPRSGSVQSTCPVLCQCGQGQSVDMRLELQTTPRGCSVGPRPNTTQPSAHLHSAGLRSNSGPLDHCCATASPHSVTDESQPKPAVCTGTCCTVQASSRPHQTHSRPTEEAKSRSSICHAAIPESSPPPSTSTKSLSTQSATSPPHFRVKSAEQSKWRTSAATEKRRVSGRTAAGAAPSGRTEHTDEKTEFGQVKPVTTNATTTAATGGGGGKPDEVAHGTEQRGIPPSSAVTDIVSSTLPSTTLCRDLPHIASDLTHVCAQLASRVTESTPRSSSVVPSGEELRQLVEAIAAIEQDVRSMSAALQSNTDNTADNCDTAVANSPSFTVLADSDQPRQPTETSVLAPGKGRTTAAVALLLPSVELSVPPPSDRRTPNIEKSDRETSSDGTRGSTSNKPPKIGGGAQKLTKDTKIDTAANRGHVMVLPPSTNNEDKVGGASRQSDYIRLSSTPTTTSRLPFRLATTQAAAVAHTDDRNRKRTGLEGSTAATGRGKSRVSADRPDDSDTDSVSSDKPRFTDIHQIIRHLESIGGSTSGSTKPPRPADGGIAQSRPADSSVPDKKPPNTAAVTEVVPPRSLRSAGTSPLDLGANYSKQTQTSPKSSGQTSPQSAVRLPQDDRNMTIKSRSLEFQQLQQQQQQQLSNPATSTAVMPLALPRSSGAVTTATTATHSVAIPLPPPNTSPAGGTVPDLATTSPAGREQESAEQASEQVESASAEQAPEKSKETEERKPQP